MTDKRDYKDTVFLPRTAFPMKAGLPQKEPGILEDWQSQDLYHQLRSARAGREKFILHDGPPYANGDIHIGHALNHVLKDMVVRSQSLLGKDAPYVPGWDCHGLPIEWKVEEGYRKNKRNKDEVPAEEFRAQCRDYAQHWVDVQRGQLQRLGILGDWDNPYLTMQYESEAGIVAELMKFAESGQLYRGAKPVMWSPVEKTALAEAEVEYEDITSTQIDVAFEITESSLPELVGAYAVIWTTTPWTIPVNQALAYGPEVDYVALDTGARTVLLAESLIAPFAERTGLALSSNAPVWRGKGAELAGSLAKHPMADKFPDSAFYTKPRPLLAGDFVTTDAGTGLVHMAPDHGEDDFALCKAHGIGPVFAVMADGRYRDDWPWLGGDDERRRAVINKAFNASEGPICKDLRDGGALLAASDDFTHSYPHSWRSKAKIIYRATAQWFIAMDQPLAAAGGATLRQKAAEEIAKTRFVPDKGRNRIGAMVEGRPDWVLSRQRAWGVPITLFVHRKSGDYLVDPAVNARIIAAIREFGVDGWAESRAAALLGADYDPADYEMVGDILDVWFDSGCTHAFVLASGRWPDLAWPADLYLEGSDQHRGWFQSSLLESCATRGRAPYKAVLTHGFTMAGDGRKMSKSLGNTVDPNKIMEQYGADIIRLWALSVDYTEDHRISDEILKGVADQYRKLRNTYRYLLGALHDYDPAAEAVPAAQMPELERYMLSLLARLDDKLRAAVMAYDFNEYTRALSDFANEDLSAFFFDIRKDCLYCDAPTSLKRRAYRTALDILFQALVRYGAPVLVFTAEEVWRARYADAASVHLLEWPEIPAGALSDEAGARWQAVRALREQVTEAIEPLRREKIIRSGLEAEVSVPESAVPEGFSDLELAELFITASVTQGQGGAVTVMRTEHHKCGRCWRLLPEVSEDGALCARCEDVLAAEGAA